MCESLGVIASSDLIFMATCCVAALVLCCHCHVVGVCVSPLISGAELRTTVFLDLLLPASVSISVKQGGKSEKRGTAGTFSFLLSSHCRPRFLTQIHQHDISVNAYVTPVHFPLMLTWFKAMTLLCFS